eukprot:gene7229-8611_t
MRWKSEMEKSDELPLRYNPTANEAYFNKRPLKVATRAAEIGGLSLNFALGLWWDATQNKIQENQSLRARQLRKLLTVLGPTFVKAGQAVSIRVDLLPPEYLAELKKLQDDVPAFPNDVALRIISEELRSSSPGSTVENTFSEISPSPVAAASLGQVYRARLRDTGEEVAVKVQRPDMLETVALDLQLLRLIAPRIKAAKGLNTDLVGIVDEWGTRFIDELDYRREAKNAMDFLLAMEQQGLQAVTTAEVVFDVTTKRVLTTKWVDGVRLDESSYGDEAKLCGVALNAYLTMLLDTRVLHADPHPGNLLRTTDGRLCILDFGLVTELTEDQTYSIIEYISHLISENYNAVPGDLGRLGFVPVGKEEAMQDAGVVKVLAEAFKRLAQGGGAKAVANAAGRSKGGGVDELGRELQDVSGKYGNLFQIPPYFAYILRAFSVLEGIGLTMDPDYAIAQACYPWLAKRLFTDDSPRVKVALKEMLYGTGAGAGDLEAQSVSPDAATDGLSAEQQLNVKRLRRLSGAFKSFNDSVAPKKAAADGSGAPDALAVTSGADGAPKVQGATQEVLDVLLAPKGSFLQELLVAELARMTDVLARDSITRAFESPLGRATDTIFAQQRDLVAMLGPLRPFLLPVPLPGEIAQWVAPALQRTEQDAATLATRGAWGGQTIEGAVEGFRTPIRRGFYGRVVVAEGAHKSSEIVRLGALVV